MPTIAQPSSASVGTALISTVKLPVLSTCNRLDWYVEKADYNVASFRYRCLLPAHFLESKGFASQFFSKARLRGDVEAAVFVKAFGDMHVELARDLYLRGRPVILDLCDNIFAPGYCSKLKYLKADNFLKMAELANAVVVSSEALARVLNPMLPQNRPAVVIADPALPEHHHVKLKSWCVELQQRSRLPAQASDSGSIKGALATLRRPIKQLMERRPVNVGARPLKKVIWFGKHGKRHATGGMCSLTQVLPALEAISRKQPLELVIISNNRRKFNAYFSSLPFASRYRGWSNEAVYEELRDAAAFLMPNGNDEFFACKSANRALLSLANGVPVIASWLDSLAPLKDVIILDDWARGLERYLLHAKGRETDVTRAARVIEMEFSPSTQGRAWLTLLAMKAAWRKAAE